MDSAEYTSSFSFEKSGAAEKLSETKTTFKHGVPLDSFLSQNYPNPFNPTTNIHYGINADTWVSMKIYNILGQEVRTLVDEFQSAGFKSILWDGKNSSDIAVPGGIYIYRISAGRFERSGIMTLLK